MRNPNPIGEKIEDFHLLEKIGSGGFAEVFKAESLRLGYEGCQVAIKRISKDFIFKKKCEQRIKNEIEIHSELSHPSIVKYHTAFEDEKYWYLVLELCEKGSFQKLLKDKQHLYEEDACRLIKQVINGVQYLQLNQVIHRDLSLRNILLAKDGTVRIADFGLAVKCRPNEKQTSVLGTANFMSPEVVMRKPYDFKADFWSVGCILYALLFGAPPFDDKKKKSIMHGAVKSELAFPGYASKEAVELLRALLKKDPRSRIEIKNALQYDFFQKYEKNGKKYENTRSGDSGMSSLSSSSRSSQKMKGTSDREKENNYEDNTCTNKGKYYCAGGRTRSGIQDDNNLRRQRAESPCKPKLKIRNRIQPLPSRREVYDTDSHLEAKQHNWEERQTWEGINRQNINRGTFSHDNHFESQFDVPIRSRPESPLYPPHLQNLSEEKINLNSCCSYYNGFDGNKNYESISKQRNFITRTNSQDNILKYSCSHDQFCPPENNCPHKSSCCCHQSPVVIPKNKSNSDCSHHSCVGERKQDPDIGNCTVEKSLKDFITPLTTVRLKPERHTAKNLILSILNDGQVCVESLKLKRNKSHLSYVCFISPDGLNITIFEPKKKIIPSDKPPTLPDNNKEVQYFSFENLPEIHWKKYQHAKLFVDIVRAKTAKVTVYGEEGKCVLMENAPCPDYEMNFYDGFQITEIGEKITVIDQNGIKLTDENKWDSHTESLVDTFQNMKELCCIWEEIIENVRKVNKRVGKSGFPVIIGSKPNASLRNLDDNKENATPRNVHSSSLNGTIAMKSYSGSINTDSSHYTNSSPASIPSRQSSKSTDTQKAITDVLPTLKCQPLMKEKCCKFEEILENGSKVHNSIGDSCFPATHGRKPNASLRNLDDNKENATPRNVHSSSLNRTIAMKSYSGSINTDSSCYTNSSPASIPSPQSSKSTDTQKAITDVLPTLKCQPSVRKGWVIAEYKDGIQMRISRTELGLVFVDTRTNQCLSSSEHPELMKRYHKDHSSIMSHALSVEVEKTK